MHAFLAQFSKQNGQPEFECVQDGLPFFLPNHACQWQYSTVWTLWNNVSNSSLSSVSPRSKVDTKIYISQRLEDSSNSRYFQEAQHTNYKHCTIGRVVKCQCKAIDKFENLNFDQIGTHGSSQDEWQLKIH